MRRLPPQLSEEFHTWSLPNGIRCIHRHVPSHVSHIGLFINAGSRDELPEEHGMAHFLEHILFKGTSHRRSYHILCRMDEVGGELNAYTSKEETVLHATFLNEHYNRALDLVADIVFNSTFPDKELEKEKTVIVDEINSYLDSPSDLIFDEYEAMIFGQHPMGRTVLGTEQSLESFTSNKARTFVNRNYHTGSMVLASVGNIPIKRLKALCEKHFGNSIMATAPIQRSVATVKNGLVAQRSLEINQDHIIIGGAAYPAGHDDRLGLLLLMDLLGGPGMNSRLNMLLRERHGYTYGVDASVASFTDCGAYTIYFSCDARHTQRCINLVSREVRKLVTSSLSSIQLHRAKQQMIGQIAISQEHNQSQMIGLGRSYLMFDRVQSWQEVMKTIDDLSPSDLLRIANELLAPQPTSLIFTAER